MAAVCIICTAVAMSIRSVPWGRSRSKEEPRPVPEWQRAGWPPPIAPDDPPEYPPPRVVPDELSDGGGSDDAGSEDGEAHHEQPPSFGAAGVPVLSAPTSQPVVQGQPVGGGVLHPPLGEWLESIPYGPPTSKRFQLLSDKGEAGTGRRWFVVRPRKCWPSRAVLGCCAVGTAHLSYMSSPWLLVHGHSLRWWPIASSSPLLTTCPRPTRSCGPGTSSVRVCPRSRC